MTQRKIEEALRPAIEEFVKNLNGYYRKHCSDEMLIALLARQMDFECCHQLFGSSTVAEAVAAGKNAADEAYTAVCWIFETVLEHGCHAGGNGHHMAQEFAEAVSKAVGEKA